MYFPFECKVCRKDKWCIRYDTELKRHHITCANCGDTEILEDIFSSNRSKRKVTKSETNKLKSVNVATLSKSISSLPKESVIQNDVH